MSVRKNCLVSSEEVEQEIQSVCAIFPSELRLESERQLSVMCAPSVQLNVFLPNEYPRVSPSLEIFAPAVNGDEKRCLLATLDSVCADLCGEPVLYSLVEKALDHFAEMRTQRAEDAQKGLENDRSNVITDEEMPNSPSEFFSGATIEDRRSIFQAHVAKITSKDQVPLLLAALKKVGKIARATHNTSAWRLVNAQQGEDGQRREIEQHDCDDDGETGAGAKLLRLLVQMHANEVLVVVSRWYGGRHLGPDRFRHICNVAREALISGRFVLDTQNQSVHNNK